MLPPGPPMSATACKLYTDSNDGCHAYQTPLACMQKRTKRRRATLQSAVETNGLCRAYASSQKGARCRKGGHAGRQGNQFDLAGAAAMTRPLGSGKVASLDEGFVVSGNSALR
jgi:hypothetical protein